MFCEWITERKSQARKVTLHRPYMFAARVDLCFLLMTDGLSLFLVITSFRVVEGRWLNAWVHKQDFFWQGPVVTCYHGKALMVPASIAFRVKQEPIVREWDVQKIGQIIVTSHDLNPAFGLSRSSEMIGIYQKHPKTFPLKMSIEWATPNPGCWGRGFRLFS